MNKIIFFAVVETLLYASFLGSLYVFTDYHESAHVQIFIHGGCNASWILNGTRGITTANPECYYNEKMYELQAENDIVGYHAAAIMGVAYLLANVFIFMLVFKPEAERRLSDRMPGGTTPHTITGRSALQSIFKRCKS